MKVIIFVKSMIKAYFKAYADAMEPFYKYNISPMEKKIEYTKDELLHLIEPHQNKYKSLREFIENLSFGLCAS